MDELIKVDGPVSYPGDCWIWRAYCPYCDRQIPHRGGKGERRHEREMEEARARRPMRAHIKDKHRGGVKHGDRREQGMSTTIEVTLNGQMDLDQAEKAANEILAKVKAKRQENKFKVGEVWSAVRRGKRSYFLVARSVVGTSHHLYLLNGTEGNGDYDCTHTTYENWCSPARSYGGYDQWRMEFDADHKRA